MKKLKATILAAGLLLMAAPPAGACGDEYECLDALTENGMDVVLHFKDTPLSDVFVTLARAGTFDLAIEIALDDVPASLDNAPATMREALVYLAGKFDLQYETPAPDDLIVSVRHE